MDLSGLVHRVTLPANVRVTSHLNLLAGEYHREDSSNVFTNKPSGSNLFDDTKHLRPEVTVIFISKSLSCQAVDLTRESCREDINSSPPFSEILLEYVSIVYCFRVVIF